ncbi:MAG TPA: thermonuclease family protein [Pyrinomonadaceae bacterium]
MKNSTLYGRLLLATVFVAATALNAAAQLRTGGQVFDVLDGKTVIVAVPTGHVTVELQYIDVPEPGQSLHGVVKDHVRTLLLGKSVELQTKGFTRGKVTGKLTLDGVDVSQQLLRNGAAWHLTMEMSGQSRDEFNTYAESESFARQEKRGVWSVAGLEPAWQFREKAKQLAVSHQPARTDTAAPQSAARRKGYWSDKNPFLKDPGGMTHGFNAATQTGFLGTSMLGVAEDKSQPAGQKTAMDLTYYYTENGKKGRTGYFVVTLVSLADNWRFLRSNTLTVEVDGKNIVVGKPKRETDNSAFKLAEKLTYRVDVATVEKIAHGADVAMKIGNYRVVPRPGIQMILYNMLQAAK